MHNKNFFSPLYLLILFAGIIHAHDNAIKGFLFGFGLNSSFAADQVTTEFLGYTGKTKWAQGFFITPRCKLGFAPDNRFELFLEHSSSICFRGDHSEPLWYPFLGLGTSVHLIRLEMPLSVYVVAGVCQMYGKLNDNDGNFGFGISTGLGYEVFPHLFTNFDISILRPKIIYKQIEYREYSNEEGGTVLKGYFNAFNRHNLLSIGFSVNYLIY